LSRTPIVRKQVTEPILREKNLGEKGEWKTAGGSDKVPRGGAGRRGGKNRGCGGPGRAILSKRRARRTDAVQEGGVRDEPPE